MKNLLTYLEVFALRVGEGLTKRAQPELSL